jgi:hypothetical protein
MAQQNRQFENSEQLYKSTTAKNTQVQTAVEWLVNEVNSDCLNSAFIRPELVEQANKMFEEQIMNSYWDGGQDVPSTKKRCQQYYKETFNK